MLLTKFGCVNYSLGQSRLQMQHSQQCYTATPTLLRRSERIFPPLQIDHLFPLAQPLVFFLFLYCYCNRRKGITPISFPYYPTLSKQSGGRTRLKILMKRQKTMTQMTNVFFTYKLTFLPVSFILYLEQLLRSFKMLDR